MATNMTMYLVNNFSWSPCKAFSLHIFSTFAVVQKHLATHGIVVMSDKKCAVGNTDMVIFDENRFRIFRIVIFQTWKKEHVPSNIQNIAYFRNVSRNNTLWESINNEMSN